MNFRPLDSKGIQRGVAAVEFAIVAVLLFTLLFGIIEFGRLFFTINSVQEITRRAAREQVVRLTNQSVPRDAQCLGVLRQAGCSATVNFPGAGDIASADVRITFHKNLADALADADQQSGNITPGQNTNNCLNGNEPCIKFVRATLTQSNGDPLDFNVIAPYMPADIFSLPRSTVIMPAEALGLL